MDHHGKSIPPQFGGKSSITNVLESTTLIQTPTPGTRRPPTRATAGVKRRRVIKKHIQQKYLLCGFAIHAFLATPAYLYGNVVDSDKELILRIWPAIVYQATGQICRSIFEHITTTDYRGNSRETYAFRRIFLLATLIICLSLMISGYLFSSAWIIVTTTTQTIAIIFYGVFAGIGSSLFIWKTHVILEAVRPREDKFVRKTIHLCGEAFCQLFLSFVFTSLHTLYGTAQSIVLMAALLVNLIPISLLITRHREGAIIKRISVIKAETGRFETFHQPLHHHSIGKYTPSLIDQMDGIELQLQRSWKNPMTVSASNIESSSSVTTAATAAAIIAADNHCNYLMNADEAYVTFMNPNGVEIMEIIPEEDENISIIRSSSATIDNFGRISIEASQTLKSSSSNGGIYQSTTIPSHERKFSNLEKIQNISKKCSIHLWGNLLNTIAIPLRRALTVPKLYTTSFLLSADIFSYVMCLTVLPGIAVTHHALKTAEIPFLFSLLAFPWMCFSLMTPRFGGSLFKRKFQWHGLGCICKGLALIFISFSTSKLLLSVSSVLLGFGQAVIGFSQDWVLQMSMPRAQWTDIRFPMHFTNGILIIIWGTLAHLVVVKYSFQASVGFAASLYMLSIIIWHLIFYFCSKRD